MFRYSASTRGFYPDNVDYGDSLPGDLIELTDEQHQELLAGQGEGADGVVLAIEPDSDGFPRLVVVPVPPVTEAQALGQRDEFLRIAALRIAPLQDAIDLDDASVAEVALVKKWKQYRVALNRISEQDGFPESVQWPDLPL